jgi:hypothetical protein
MQLSEAQSLDFVLIRCQESHYVNIMATKHRRDFYKRILHQTENCHALRQAFESRHSLCNGPSDKMSVMYDKMSVMYYKSTSAKL